MTAGFFVKGDAGIIQVDENYQNYMLKQRVAISVASSSANYQTKTATITASANAIMACRTSVLSAKGGTACNATILKAVYASGSWTVTLMCWNSSGATISAYIYVFDVGVTPSENNGGLAVWDEDGKLVFHSSGKPLRIVETWRTGRTLALIHNRIGVLMIPPRQGLAGTGTCIRLGAYLHTTGVDIAQVFATQFDSSGGQMDPIYYLVDVTDYD